MDFKKLYRELVRRNVFRAVVAYLAVAWVLIEVSSTILPTFDAPPILLKGLIYLLGIGLIVWTGFSWVYDLTPQGIRKTPEVYHTSETRDLNSRRLNAVILGAGLVAMLVLLAGSFWAGSRWSKVTDSSPNYRIAVLPFEDRSANAEFEYLREGLAEDVIGKLFNFSGVSVISSRSVFQFKDSDKSIEQISGELKADIVLMGNYTITGEKVDVKVEVIGTKDNQVLNYASIAGDISHIRDISFEIGKRLQEALGIPSTESWERGGIAMRQVNPEAFKLNALGKSAMRYHTGQKLEDITRYFEAAIELDPEYMDPYIGMAEAFVFDVNRGYMSPAEAAVKVKEYALKAEKLNPGSGEVSCMMGIIHSFAYDFKNSISYFEKALEKSPNFILTYQWYPFALILTGDFQRAEELQEKAMLLDPLSSLNEMLLAIDYVFQDKHDKALALIDSKLAMDPDDIQMIWMKAVCLADKGLFDQAYETILKRKKYLDTNFISAYIFAKVGDNARAEAVLNEILARSKKQYVPPSQIAFALCGLGRYDQALEQIEEAFLVHDQWLFWVVYTSLMDPIKQDPRYTSLVSELGWVKT